MPSVVFDAESLVDDAAAAPQRGQTHNSTRPHLNRVGIAVLRLGWALTSEFRDAARLHRAASPGMIGSASRCHAREVVSTKGFQ